MNGQPIKEMYAAIDDARWEDLGSLFHDRIVYERPGYPPFEGLERVLHFYREERIIATGHHETEGIVCNGDQAASWGRFIGRDRNDSHLDVLYSEVFELEGGRIIKRRSYFYRSCI